jgi:hypothetical protein
MIDRRAETRWVSILYGSLVGLLSLLFLSLLRDPILSALPEQDLWWMLPMLSHYVDGKPLSQVLGFLLGPAPYMLGQPALKIYLSLGNSSWLGLYTTHLIMVSVGVHAANAGLLYWLSRQLGLSRRVSLCSALVYFTSFAHFHAYLWPTAAQHVFAVFTILLMLNLYLNTEQRIDRHARYTWLLVGMWAVTIAASLQRSTLIAPALILTHILVCSKDPQDRIAKYDRWLPLFVAYLLYPAMALTFVGDHIITTAFVPILIPPIVKALMLFLGGVACLMVIRWLLRMPPLSWRGRLVVRGLILSAIVGGLVILSLNDRRQVLWPYNALVPFITTLTSFLEPLQAVFLIDSTEPYHYISPQISVFSVLLSLLLIGTFIAVFVTQKKPLIIVLVWYVLSLGHLLSNYSSFHVRIPSRYFIYLSPVFAVIFSAVLIHGYSALVKNTRLKPLSRDIILAGLLISLSIPNLLAIRLELFRGKLANTYMIYDDIRTASLIRDDLRHSNAVRRQPGAIYVTNVPEMPVEQFWSPTPADPAKFETFRDVVGEIFRDRAMRAIRVNEFPTSTAGNTLYVVSNYRVQDAQGVSIDPFARLFDGAVTRMAQNRHQEARELFQRAIEYRPFFLRYVLSDYRLDDVRWITNGLDLRQWVNKAGAAYPSSNEAPVPKTEHILTLMNRELSDYLLAMFYLSYLEHRSGHADESRRWLSKMQFLERDPEALSSWIRQVPLVRADRAMLEFLERLKDPAYFRDPLPWWMDDYGFLRFLVRFLFRWDIQSSWDRGQNTRMWR